MLTIVALVALLLAATILLSAVQTLRWASRVFERKDRANAELLTRTFELVDRAMYAAGKPWKQAPAVDDSAQRADEESRRRTAELEEMWDGIVEDPAPGAAYRSHVADIEELHLVEGGSVFDHAPAFFDTTKIDDAV